MVLSYMKKVEVECDIEQAEEDFKSNIIFDEGCSDNQRLRKAVYDNLIFHDTAEDPPDWVIDTFINTLRSRIGGEQMKMDLDNSETVHDWDGWFRRHRPR